MKKSITKEQIIETALDLLKDKSDIRSVNLREIARVLGCAHTNLYNYFPSFNDLLWEAHMEIENQFIKKIALELESVQDGYLKIGSLTTFTELQNEPLICQHAQALYEAACSVGSPQIRNLGTLGGNIANASVAADSIAPLMSLDAELTLVSMLGLRNMAVCDFFAGERATALREHELIRDIRIPCSKMAQASTYVKLAKRKALAIVVLGLAIMLRCDDDGICTDARVVLGAVSRFPRRIINAEQMLIGQPVGEKAFDACIPVLSETVKQLIPNRASEGYKSESVRGAAKQAFNQIISALL